MCLHMQQCLQQCVAGPPCRSDPVYLRWRARCLVLSGQPQAAWELHAAAQAAGHSAAVGEAGCALLQQIADDCYRMGAFYYAVKVGVAACVVLCSSRCRPAAAAVGGRSDVSPTALTCQPTDPDQAALIHACLFAVAQALDVLERLDPTAHAYEAKRGAAVGAFQMVVAGKEAVCVPRCSKLTSTAQNFPGLCSPTALLVLPG